MCCVEGLVQTLDGLNIRNNPLEFPPPEVLQKGTRKILTYMRRLLQAKSDVSKTGCSIVFTPNLKLLTVKWSSFFFTRELVFVFVYLYFDLVQMRSVILCNKRICIVYVLLNL